MYRTSNGRLAVVTATKTLFILCVFYLHCFVSINMKKMRLTKSQRLKDGV